MRAWFEKADEYCKGYLGAILLLLLELVLVYIISNTPFVLTALDNKGHLSIYQSFTEVLQNELTKGQLLTFVCTLTAPVVFWAVIESKKNILAKTLFVLAIIPYCLSMYIQGKGSDFGQIKSFELYLAAIAVWILYLAAYRFPPPRKDFIQESDNDTNSFLKKTKEIEN